MIALLSAAILWLAAVGIGRTLLLLFRLTPNGSLQTFCYSSLLGYGFISYAILGLGLLQRLTGGWIGAVIAFCLLCGAASLVRLRGVRNPVSPNKVRGPAVDVTTSSRLVTGVALVVLLIAGVLAFTACFVPPGVHEWDALSYHLAAPQAWLRMGGICVLPTDHHSNFPFLVEMLYLVALRYGDYRSAALIHFTFASTTVLLMISASRVRSNRPALLLAAAAFVITPIVLWESGIAYIDIALAAYSLAALLALIGFMRTRERTALILAGIMIGFALSVKALALIPLALMVILLLKRRAPLRALGLWLILAAAIGSPFYVKAWVQMGNPVYPFAYGTFGGKYWSSELSAKYAVEQRSYGENGNYTRVSDDVRGVQRRWEPPFVGDHVAILLLAAWNLIAIPRLFYNYYDPGMHGHAGFLFLALPLAAWCARTVRGDRWFLWLTAMLWYAIWTATMQYTRYLIPVIPIALLAGALGLGRALHRVPALAVAVSAALALQCIEVAITYIPELPARFSMITDSRSADEYLRHTLNVYPAETWISEHTPPHAGVALFEETRGFYLRRRTLWANSPHSLYIPYGQFTTGRQMADWFLRHEVQYALLNLQFAPQAATPTGARDLQQAVAHGGEAALALSWYSHVDPAERWRALLGMALMKGGAVIIPEACSHAVIVLQFRPAAQASP